MKHHAAYFVVLQALLTLSLGCSRDVAGGNPKLPLASKNGSSWVAPANEYEVLRSITNAFYDGRYRHMYLYDAKDYNKFWTFFPKPSGFVLFSLYGSFTNVPLDSPGGNWVPYGANFRIVLTPLSPNETKVTVRTIESKVADGKDLFNVHGGEAIHYRNVPPVLQEETNVLWEIHKQVNAKNTALRTNDRNATERH